MAYLIGTDEAGYGPNLGPLVIAATVWRVPSLRATHGKEPLSAHAPSSRGLRERSTAPRTSLEPPRDLYDDLQAAVCLVPDRTDRIAVADSKQLYRPGGDLGLLQRGVLAALATLPTAPTRTSTANETIRDLRFRELCAVLAPAAIGALDTLPWYADYNPVVANPSISSVKLLKRSFAATNVALIDIKAQMIFADAFNDGVRRFDSKGAVLSLATLDLVAKLVDRLPKNEPISIVCDKHGGRNKYGPLLQPHFGDRLVQVICEGRRSSQYKIGTVERPIDIRFDVGGESFLPSALASMTAKYLRELCMQGFNRFWQNQVANLRPTAGYPVDARRFKAEIAAAQMRLKIDDHRLWRER